MNNAKKTLTVMLAMAILVSIIFIYYFSTRKDSPSELPEKTEVEQLLEKDLNIYYPGTPREVIKLYSSMLKALYSSDTENDQLKDLALKIRKLYDEELLEKNPEEDYLNNLFLELSAWKDANRQITNFYLDDNSEQQKTIDGKEYATIYASYVVVEEEKSIQEWKFLLRKDKYNEWRILGWEVLSNEIEG